MVNLSLKETKMIKRILKTNHAGEFGAIRIYKAQLLICRKFYPEMIEFLETTLQDEIEHCQLFLTSMPSRNTRPCYVSHRWGEAGYILGFLTALMGQQAIWACTVAVEGVVHKHLEAQLNFLLNRDLQLYDQIRAIQIEEFAHLNYAKNNLNTNLWHTRMLVSLISMITEAIIWLATLGDSTHMEKHLIKFKLKKA